MGSMKQTKQKQTKQKQTKQKQTKQKQICNQTRNKPNQE